MTHEELVKSSPRTPGSSPARWAMRVLGGIVYFAHKTFNIFEMEMRKLRHEPLDLFTRAAQPFIWLVIFGQVMSSIRAVPIEGISYLEFMAPGVLAQSVLFVSIFYGLALIWERDLGIVHKFLASPVPREALVLGKGMSSGVRGFSQSLIVILLASLLGVRLNLNPVNLIGVVLIVFLGALTFSTFSLLIALWVKTRERFMGVGQFITMPMFFASNAIYPIEMMPDWLQAIARFNPLSYMVDALRTLMLPESASVFGLGMDFLVLIGVPSILVLIAGRRYPNFVI
jgi:ABC-2 type transport system permease protein